jgi:adenosylmethionine-8-amino-7-oxononanoate aminotransferase
VGAALPVKIMVEKNYVLTNFIDEALPVARLRSGSSVSTADRDFIEISGGSHASFIINHNLEILQKITNGLHQAVLPLSGRNYGSDAQNKLAALIAAGIGDDEAKVYFTSGGTEGIETALRLAFWIQRSRGFKERRLVISRSLSYHGMSVYTRSIADHHQHSYEDLGTLYQQPKFLLNDPLCVKCSFGLTYPTCELKCAQQLEDMVQEVGSDQIAALIIEPVGGTTAGAVVPPTGYLEELARICRKHGILFIADEVVSSFYRTGKFFWTCGIEVDIRVGGKCLSGGYGPICSVILSGHLTDELRTFGPVPLRLTYAGSPLMCLTALAVQEVITERNMLDQWSENEQLIKGRLELFTSNRTGFSYRGTGCLWAISVEIQEPDLKQIASRYTRHFKNKGLEVMVGIRPNDLTIHFMFAPALDVTTEDLIAEIDLFFNAINDYDHEQNI